MRIITTIDTDVRGRCWPVFQFGPVDDEKEAQAMLETLSELLTERFGGARPETKN